MSGNFDNLPALPFKLSGRDVANSGTMMKTTPCKKNTAYSSDDTESTPTQTNKYRQ